LVATVAPHLANIAGQAKSDSHLKKTRDIRALFKKEDFRDSTINDAQLADLPDPLPHSIWKKILLDEYVDFAKLFASMDHGYDHNDEAENFMPGYAIVKKDHIRSKKLIQTEADWIRIFGSWEAGVTLIYPHRKTELQGYRQIVTDVFRASPNNPSIAIEFDGEVRDRYAKHPFHMDDRNQLNLPLMTQLFRAAGASTTGNSLKRAASPSLPSAKRTDVPCRNWSWGRCQDPCPNRRKHGICCICGENHQAKDNEACSIVLHARIAESAPVPS